MDLDDAVQIAGLGFTRALERFDLDRDGLWVTCLRHWARSALNLECRTMFRRKRAACGPLLSLDEPRGDPGATLLEFVRAPETEADPLPNVDLTLLLEALTARQRHVVERRARGLDVATHRRGARRHAAGGVRQLSGRC
jgi:hypothetical protein